MNWNWLKSNGMWPTEVVEPPPKPPPEPPLPVQVAMAELIASEFPQTNGTTWIIHGRHDIRCVFRAKDGTHKAELCQAKNGIFRMFFDPYPAPTKQTPVLHLVQKSKTDNTNPEQER